MEISDDDLFDKRIEVIITTENDMLFDSMIKVHMTYTDQNEELFQNKIKVCIVEAGDEDDASCFSELEEEEEIMQEHEQQPGRPSRFGSIYQKMSGLGDRVSKGVDRGIAMLPSGQGAKAAMDKTGRLMSQGATGTGKLLGQGARGTGSLMGKGARGTGSLMVKGATGTGKLLGSVASGSMEAATGAKGLLPSKEYMKKGLRLIPNNNDDLFEKFIHVNFVDMKFEDMMKDKQSQSLIKALYVQMIVNDIKLIAGNAREQEFIDQIKNFSMMDDTDSAYMQHKMEYIEKHGLYAIKQITSLS